MTDYRNCLVSLVTPTYDRDAYLPLIHKCILNQTYTNWEWIVIDDSQEESAFMLGLNDPRIIYNYEGKRISIGEKRNLCSEIARGEFIVHFDDDEYYAPQYVDSMIQLLLLKSGDIIKLSGFFIFSKVYKQFAYWDLLRKTGIHYIWSSDPMVVGVIEDTNNDLQGNHLGYGFSYVYKKKVASLIKFEHVSFNEDRPFIESAMALGFKTHLLADDVGLCIHVLHDKNTSRCFPQYLLPTPIVHRLFLNLPQDPFRL